MIALPFASARVYWQNEHRRAFPLVCTLASAMVLSSCIKESGFSAIDPLKIEKTADDSRTAEIIAADIGANREKIFASDGPMAPLGRTLAEPFTTDEAPALKGEKVSVNFEGIRLPAFANSVFGEILKVSFEIDSAVQQREQLVTLQTADSLSPSDFLKLVRQVLSNYGVSVVYQNNIFRIVDSAGLRKDIPRIVRSRTMPNVPDDQRPVFFYISLSAIPAGLMQQWLNQSLPERLTFQTLPNANGLLILGKPEDIEAARETIAVLDQPAMAGFKSMRIAPAFWSADKLTNQLVEVLTAEGYSVAVGGGTSTSIKLVPVRALNTIIVFCSDDILMRHVMEWATELDQPGQKLESKGIYYHPVYNTKAADLSEIIGKLLGAAAGSSTQTRMASGSASGGVTPTVSGSNTDQKSTAVNQLVIVDEGRNALIFQGTAEEYAQFRSLVEQMDRAPLEVLIEATVAEVTLKEGETLGAVLAFNDATAPKAASSLLRSSDGLFVSLIRDTGQLSIDLKALRNKSRVNILSTPRVVASSGKTASIQIGTQVPIITTQQTSPNGTVGGTSALLQDIQYRNTGVILSIEPIINSNRRVELSIEQEVSEAQVNDVSDVQSPLILTRRISTSLSLDDGETVLLGGLISENFSKSENGIPLLMDIPVLGNLFKTNSVGRNRTELIVLLTTYIIDRPETARALRDAFRERLTGLPIQIESTKPSPP